MTMLKKIPPRTQLHLGIASVVAVIVVAALVVSFFVGRNTAPAGPVPVGGDHRASPAQERASSDIFGVKFIQPTAPGGTYWTSHWGPSRTFQDDDPVDPWFDTFNSDATYKAGEGLLQISGEVPRMYVHDPALERQWGDVEITVYFKRVADAGVPYAGMTAVARANHLSTEEGVDDLCDTRGYGARMRSDGHVDFEKETAHPFNEAVANRALWPSLPKNVWIGYKFIVYDVGDAVHLELWRDMTDALRGGKWEKVNEVVDTGSLFGEESCKAGIDPRMQLSNSPNRIGSESGKPNVSVYFRSDGVSENGLVYKWASVREIKVGK